MMPKFFSILPGILIFLFALSSASQGAQADERKGNIERVIAYLIEEVAKSNLTFIRNGERHTCEEAARHIRRKYDYFKSRIESPEDFIRLCASKSLVSGKSYLVSTPQGDVTMESWLGQILARYRRSKGSDSFPESFKP